MAFGLLRGERFDIGCRVEIINEFESLEAHVVLDGDTAIEPGDEVIVHGAPVSVPYGERASIARTATVTRAGLIERAWTKMFGDLEFMELCEFSFSEEFDVVPNDTPRATGAAA